jgi:hypothetical protein
MPILSLGIEMMVTGSKESMNECWRAIQDHVHKFVRTEECDEFPLHTWNRITIDTFYQYCFAQQVLPEINPKNDRLALSGPAHEVKVVQMEFYRMKSVKAEEARIVFYARIAVWVFESFRGVVEKYSLKLNALIEDAHNGKMKSVRLDLLALSYTSFSIF